MRHRKILQISATSRGRRGITLAETLMATFLLSIVLVGALKLVSSSLQARISQAQLSDGSLLARDLMAEIAHARYEEPDEAPLFGRESGESSGARPNWDDLDDYDGWSASPPESRDGSVLAGFANWTREVEVRYVPPNDTNGTGNILSDEGLKRVVLTVSDPRGHQTTRTMVRSRFGSYEVDQMTGTTVMRQVIVGLRFTSNPASQASSSVSILDHAPVN